MLNALEAINFQGKSKFGKDLTDIFQDVMDFRDSLKYDNMSDKEKINYRIQSVSLYLEKVTKNSLAKAIKEHTNLTLDELIQTGNSAITGMFAIQMATEENMSEFAFLANRGTGYGGDIDKTGKSLRKKIEALIEYSNTLDIKSGKFESSTYGEVRTPMSITLYIDPNMAFHLDLFMDMNLVGGNMTARELAAIYLHEVGHMVSIIERFRDSYLYTKTLVGHISKELKLTSNEELLDIFVNSSDELLYNPKIKEVLSEKTYSTYSTYINTIKEGTKIFMTDSVPSAVVIFIMKLIISLLGIVIGIYGVAVAIPFSNISSILGESSPSKNKISDSSQSKNYMYRMERDADEYVVRSGYASDIASGLSKVWKVFDLLGYQTLNKNLIECNLYWKLASFFSCVGKAMNTMETEIATGYEDQVSRIYRLIQNNRIVFKQKLPDYVADLYLKEHDKLLSILNKNKEAGKLSSAVNRYMAAFNSPAKLVSAITTGRLVNDYEKWQNQLDDIINNEMYYQAQKFKQLTRKK